MATKYVFNDFDYTPLINLANDIMDGSYVDDRFTNEYKRVLKVFIDNADDFDGERKLFNGMRVSDFYYQAAKSIIDENGDDTGEEELLTQVEMADMFWGNIHEDILNYPETKHSCVKCSENSWIQRLKCHYITA